METTDMALSKAKYRANKRYNDKSYDKMTINLKKGIKPLITAKAESEGKSLNKYIVDLIYEALKDEADIKKSGD